MLYLSCWSQKPKLIPVVSAIDSSSSREDILEVRPGLYVLGSWARLALHRCGRVVPNYFYFVTGYLESALSN